MAIKNRIRHLRNERGMTAEDLAALVGTTQMQISRLERGERKLTVEWIMRLAKALDVAPWDVLGPIALTDIEDDAEPVSTGNAQIDASLAATGVALYRPNSGVLQGLGIGPDAAVSFDMTAPAISRVATGDVVLIRLVDQEQRISPRLLMRQWIAPDMLTTNHEGRNFAFHLVEQEFRAEIVGVHKVGAALNGSGASS